MKIDLKHQSPLGRTTCVLPDLGNHSSGTMHQLESFEMNTLPFEPTWQQGINLECCHHTEMTRTPLVRLVTESKHNKIAKGIVL